MSDSLRTAVAKAIFGDGSAFADNWHTLNEKQRRAYYTVADRVIGAIASGLDDLVCVVQAAQNWVEDLPVDDCDEPWIMDDANNSAFSDLVSALRGINDSDLGSLVRLVRRAVPA